MIDVKQAVLIAKQKSVELLNQASANLEEIEREIYNGHDVWSITLSVPRSVEHLSPLTQLSADPMQYKRFLIDVESGELVAMKLREFASR